MDLRHSDAGRGGVVDLSRGRIDEHADRRHILGNDATMVLTMSSDAARGLFGHSTKPM